MEYKKVQSASKQVIPTGPDLQKIILNTLATISNVVGGTLGPGGHPVLIERFETGLPPIITKDGVTVFKSLGFQSPAAQSIMEAARDASVRTAIEAGDGTTTATILAEALVRNTLGFCSANRKVSPQLVVSEVAKVFKNELVPLIESKTRKLDFYDEIDRAYLYSVAKISANGDSELADAVIKCFEITGDQGNVTIVEQSGPNSYEVEHINGYPMASGYEDSCAKFYPEFINDQGNQRVWLDKPLFILYHGTITEIQTLVPLLNQVGDSWTEYVEGRSEFDTHNVVIMACGYSESVLASLAGNFKLSQTINVLPMVVPRTQQLNGQLFTLQDLAAITGAKILDPITAPLERAIMANLGPGIEAFEALRGRCTVFGYVDEDLIAERATELEAMVKNPESELDRLLLLERLGKLTGGIAKLKVVGSSNGELRERKDRADDAVCAVKGAIKSGCLPGGGWTLMYIFDYLINKHKDNAILMDVLAKSLLEPVDRLFANAGFIKEERESLVKQLLQTVKDGNIVFDVLNKQFVEPYEAGILDSAPAVIEALKNSISIATLLGTLGGVVVFNRDDQFEREEARATSDFLRNADSNPANERW